MMHAVRALHNNNNDDDDDNNNNNTNNNYNDTASSLRKSTARSYIVHYCLHRNILFTARYSLLGHT